MFVSRSTRYAAMRRCVRAEPLPAIWWMHGGWLGRAGDQGRDGVDLGLLDSGYETLERAGFEVMLVPIA